MSKASKLAQLRDIMTTYNLTPEDVSVLCKRSLGTVYVWLTASQTRPIPDETLELLAIRAQQKTPTETKGAARAAG